MQATPEQIDALEQLQEIDRRRLRATLALKDLPQPARIKDLQEKKADVQGKREKIETLQHQQESQMARLSEEDEHLKERARDTQQKIDEAKDDYRAVNSLTRDLEGIAKRRETLEFEMNKIVKKIDEISAVAEQAGRAIAQLSAQEASEHEDFEKRAVELRRIVADAQTAGEQMQEKVGSELLEKYRAATEKCGGVGIAHLEEDRCSACRNVIEPNRLLQVRRQAPVGACPSCGRVLIVG